MTEHAEGRLVPREADNAAVIYEDKRGMLWVTHQELLDCGYINLCDFDIVYLNEAFYELQGHSKVAHAWWIEKVEMPDVSTDETEGSVPEESVGL